MKLLLMNNDLPIVRLKREDEKTYTLEWDEKDPRCAEINTWTEDDWIEALENALNRTDGTE